MVTMVDENSGHISQPAHGHKVSNLHGDAERVNTSLSPSLGSNGIKLRVSLPGHHAHRAERKHQTIDARARSVAATLPYHLPPELTLLLKQSVGETSTTLYVRPPPHSRQTKSYPVSNRRALLSASVAAPWYSNPTTNDASSPTP